MKPKAGFAAFPDRARTTPDLEPKTPSMAVDIFPRRTVTGKMPATLALAWPSARVPMAVTRLQHAT